MSLLRSAPLVAFNLLLLLCLGGCGEKRNDARRASGGPPPVHVAKAERQVVPLTLDAIGAVEPSRTASVRPQVTGTLLKIDFIEGQDVQAGDLLFEIDPRPFQNALRSAEADLQRIRVQHGNAAAQLERYRPLSADAAISQEQFRSIEDAERTSAAQILAAEAAVANARLQLDYCSVRAPITGRTGAFGAHEGDLVNASNATPLVIVNQLSPTFVTFSVPQQYLAELAHYRSTDTLAVSALPPGTDNTPETGELTFLDNAVDSSTGTIKLKATFANTSLRLWPGQFVSVRLTLAKPEVISIPNSAVQNSQNGRHVFVVKDDRTTELRPVTVERTAGNTAVIAKGLSEGETVVTEGQLRVIPGKPVDIKPSDTSAAPARAPRK